jgi:glycosyltransferase EpsF
VNQAIRVGQIVGKMVGGGMESAVMNYRRHVDWAHVQYGFFVDSDSTSIPKKEITSLGGRVFRISPYQHRLQYWRVLIRLFRWQRGEIVRSHINMLGALVGRKKTGIPAHIAHSLSAIGKGESRKT